MRMPPLLFDQISFQSFELGKEVIDLFADDGRAGEDTISRLPEQVLVKWLMQNQMARGLLCKVLSRSPQAFMGAEIQDPFYRPQEGDIDLLICNHEAPHEAVALECKRIRVVVEDEENESVSKLQEVGEGVKQAKKLYNKCGLFQTYLVILAAIHAANRKQLSIPLRGPTADSISNYDPSKKTTRSIVEFPRREELPSDIGIIFIELVQTSGKRFEDQGTLRICVHHPAAPRVQSPSATQKVEELIGRTS